MPKILLIEDDNLIRKTVELKFKKEQLDVVCACDGREGLQKLPIEMPDIVLTDLMLPYASGLEIVSAVKALEGKRIPVIIFSTMGQEHIVEEAFRLGADDFIAKPFSLTELTIRIKNQLKKPE